MRYNNFTGKLTDHIVCSLANMTATEFQIAVINGELPPPMPRKQGTRRMWDEAAIMEWLARRRQPRRALG